jgi:hypothetical protein
MRFFFYEIVARIVAIYLCYDCGRKLWYGLVEGRINYVRDGDLISWFVDWSNLIAYRDATPIRYWTRIGIITITLLVCLVVAIFGWISPAPENKPPEAGQNASAGNSMVLAAPAVMRAS